MSEVKGMLASFLDDRLSITAPSVTLSRDAGNLPGGSPSEKRARIDVGDSYSDLIPVHKKQNLDSTNLDSTKLDVREEFLAKLDEEMPDSIEYGKEIPDKLASRIVGHFVHKSESADARKIINERHKLPSNCKDICVPKLRESLLNVKTFNEMPSAQRDLFITFRHLSYGVYLALLTFCLKLFQLKRTLGLSACSCYVKIALTAFTWPCL